ncbi:hypothetical protein CLOSS21_03205 [Clostridium sp. SS2/1]|jgi:predicted ATP-dependent endonuclease of OLD family|nr:hypothetical protein CLOSS21_03205 [Clostridium sp. SS2/1]
MQMRIEEVKIKNFRSIKSATFRMNKITAVVGENNAGKTAVLRAINAVLNYMDEEMSFKNKTHQYAVRSNTYITISFVEVPDKVIYKDKIDIDKLVIKFVYKYSKDKEQYMYVKDGEEKSVDDEFMKNLSKDIKYVYIPAGRTNKDVSWEENSIFKEVVSNYMYKHTKNRDRISGDVRKVAKKIHDSALTTLEKDINTLYMQNQTMDFKFDFADDLDYSVLLKKIKFSLNECGTDYLLKEWGSGTKSLAVIAMYRANALLEEESIVLGIEEPETNLHPQAQKRFIHSLRNELHDNETQTIFTTHSTVLVDELQHEDIILIRRKKDSKRGFKSVLSQLQKNFWEKYGLEEFKHYQFFNYKNSDFFFSKYVVIGESKNDIQVIKKLIESKIQNVIADVSFLELGGIEFLKYPYFLLKELEIPYMMVVDKDVFFDYKNGKVDESRDVKSGLPKYKYEMKDNIVLKDIFKTDQEMRKIERLNSQGYKKFVDEIKKYNILSMNYCLEMDLMCSKRAREIYYMEKNILPEHQTQKYILVNQKKAIKDIKIIMKIMDELVGNSYPISYKKIKAAIIEDITNKLM